MQKSFCLIVFFFAGFTVQAQNTVNISGNTLKTNEVTYAYSVGEVTGFQLTQNCLYTQGVIQPFKQSFRPGNFFLFSNSHQILLYPNPVRDIIVIETNYPDISTYQITAFDGRVVETGKFNYLPINVKRLQSGLYFLTLFSSDYKLKQTFKIMKL